MAEIMAPTRVKFSWVNYDSASVVRRDEENISIIKSHAMRMVHRDRHKYARTAGIHPKKKRAASCIPKAESASSLVLVDKRDPVLYEPERLRTDWEAVAICAFMDDFVCPQVSLDKAHHFLNFLPKLYNRYDVGSPLTEAVSAIALARWANQNRAPGLAVRARKAYTNALTGVNQNMKDMTSLSRDHLLTALVLLTKYEMVSGDDKLDTWQLHDRGQAALVLQQGDDYLRTETGAALFRLIYTRQCLNCIARCQKPTISMTSGSWQLAFPTPYYRCTMKMMASMAELVHSAHRHSSSRQANADQLCRIAHVAVGMDAEITSFIKQTSMLPGNEHTSIQIDLQDERCTKKEYSPKSVNVFTDLQVASLYHIFWYGRLHVLQILLQYANYQLKWQREELQARLQETIDHLCHSIPCALEDTDCPKVTSNARGGKAVAVHYLIWGLSAASSAPGVPAAQREWILQRVEQVGNAHGLRQALVFA